MRKFLWRVWMVLPAAAALGLAGGCTVSQRQLGDMAASTAVRVFVQSVVSMLEAAIIEAG